MLPGSGLAEGYRCHVAKFGKLDILVSNAGIGGVNSAIEDLSLEDWQKVIDINLTANFLGEKAGIRPSANDTGVHHQRVLRCWPGWVATGPSLAVRVGSAGKPRYGAEPGPTWHRYRVNSVHPGWIDTIIPEAARDAIVNGAGWSFRQATRH